MSTSSDFAIQVGELLQHISELERDLAECRKREQQITLNGWSKAIGVSRQRAYQLRDIGGDGFPPVIAMRNGHRFYSRRLLDRWLTERRAIYPGIYPKT